MDNLMNQNQYYQNLITKVRTKINDLSKDQDTEKTLQTLERLHSVLSYDEIDKKLSTPPILRKVNSVTAAKHDELKEYMYNAPLTVEQKAHFMDNWSKNAVVNHNLLKQPGTHFTLMELANNDPVNLEMLNHYRTFAVGTKWKGPYENSLALFSNNIELASPGDIMVDDKLVEVKASATADKKASNCGRLGDDSKMPSDDTIRSIIFNYDPLMEQLEDHLSRQKSANIKTFTTAFFRADFTQSQRKEIAHDLFSTIFGETHSKPLVQFYGNQSFEGCEEYAKKLYNACNFDWYKNSDQGGHWEYLVAISFKRGRGVVIDNWQHLSSYPLLPSTPSIITSGKKMEMLTALNIAA